VKGPNKETFMDDVERLVREILADRPDLVIWRGEYAHKHIGELCDFDTLLVGISDMSIAKGPPTIAILQVWSDNLGGAHYDRSIGDANDTSGRYPPGRLSEAIEVVGDLAQQLPSF
jgi:hypothetical protein